MHAPSTSASAVSPAQDKATGLVLPSVNSKELALHLQEISQTTIDAHNTNVVLSHAGFHLAKD